MYKAFMLFPFACSEILNHVCARACVVIYTYMLVMIIHTLEALYFKFGVQKAFLERYYLYGNVNK
jgi:hypothetical protein